VGELQHEPFQFTFNGLLKVELAQGRRLKHARKPWRYWPRLSRGTEFVEWSRFWHSIR
jgi:hypothetical protein